MVGNWFTATKKYQVSQKCGVKLKGCDERGKGQILAVFINSVVVNLDRPRIKGS